jgi:transposase
MKAIHGGKAKNDKIDSQKIAALLRGGMLPQAYVYPAEMRATRDLFRRRTHLMRKRLVTPFRIGLSVMGSMATQQVHTIADLHRQFNEWLELGTDYNAFYKQLDKSAAPEFFLRLSLTS